MNTIAGKSKKPHTSWYLDLYMILEDYTRYYQHYNLNYSKLW